MQGLSSVADDGRKQAQPLVCRLIVLVLLHLGLLVRLRCWLRGLRRLLLLGGRGRGGFLAPAAGLPLLFLRLLLLLLCPGVQPLEVGLHEGRPLHLERPQHILATLGLLRQKVWRPLRNPVVHLLASGVLVAQPEVLADARFLGVVVEGVQHGRPALAAAVGVVLAGLLAAKPAQRQHQVLLRHLRQLRDLKVVVADAEVGDGLVRPRALRLVDHAPDHHRVVRAGRLLLGVEAPEGRRLAGFSELSLPSPRREGLVHSAVLGGVELVHVLGDAGGGDVPGLNDLLDVLPGPPLAPGLGAAGSATGPRASIVEDDRAHARAAAEGEARP
mmetsp:Transcript_9694/g.24219  ORF Transcript_9694/g.24219 Transcript_9694/m.24219 type:complete len:329 (-) Transcript_9694:516-1502(-)